MVDRAVLVPDTDGELVSILGELEESLGGLLPVPEVDDDWDAADPPLDGTSLDALRRVLSRLLAAERNPATQFAPDDFELIPLRVVLVDPADVVVVGEGIAALGRATLPGADEMVSDWLRETATARSSTPAALVERWARAHGLLDLVPDEDAELLAERLDGETDRVVFTRAEEAAYRRYTDRVLTMFHAHDPLARFVYRGAL